MKIVEGEIYYTVIEAAKKVGISRTMMGLLLERGEIPYIYNKPYVSKIVDINSPSKRSPRRLIKEGEVIKYKYNRDNIKKGK